MRSAGSAVGTGAATGRAEGALSTRAASISDRTGKSRSPSTMPASARLPLGNKRPAGDARDATAMGRSPRIGGTPPSSEMPPTTTKPCASRWGSTPEAARMPIAIGRSKAAPTLRTSDGARLTVTRELGNGKPELRIAVRTRSRLSRTVASGSPTIVTPGKPPDATSTSTDTGIASIPITAAAEMRASTRHDRSKARAIADGKNAPDSEGRCKNCNVASQNALRILRTVGHVKALHPGLRLLFAYLQAWGPTPMPRAAPPGGAGIHLLSRASARDLKRFSVRTSSALNSGARAIAPDLEGPSLRTSWSRVPYRLTVRRSPILMRSLDS